MLGQKYLNITNYWYKILTKNALFIAIPLFRLPLNITVLEYLILSTRHSVYATAAKEISKL